MQIRRSAVERRVGDEDGVGFERVARASRVDWQVVGTDVDMSGALQLSGQGAFAGARLDESGGGTQLRQKRRERFGRRRVCVFRASGEFRPLAHVITLLPFRHSDRSGV
jgi:hypothetical protein